MTNRIGGDFNADAVEAFRSAYAAQYMTPEDLDTDDRTGLPTGEVSNTSPWIQHTGLWKANNGMSRDFKPNQPFNPEDYITQEESVFSLEDLSEEELDQYLNSLSSEDLIALNESLNGESAEMTDDEIDNLIAELQGDNEPDD
jgi:hypothetical protein